MVVANEADKAFPLGVLDIETGLDPVAVHLLGRSSARLAGRPALHRIRSATLLSAMPSGDAIAVTMRSWHIGELGEDELAIELDRELACLRDRDGVLCTFNGRRHDLPIIRRRLARHMCFSATGATHWSKATSRHVDLMTDGAPSEGKWSTLREEAAGLGIIMPAAPVARDAAAASMHSEIDSAATYLIYLFRLAEQLRDGRPLIAGWRGLASMIRKEARFAHLQPLAKPAALPLPM